MRKKSAGWMDKIYKKILIECSVSPLKQSLSKVLHAADVRYNLDCWLVWACLSSAILTTITLLRSVSSATDSTYGRILL